MLRESRFELDRPLTGLEIGDLDRHQALRETLRLYIEHMHANLPVHEW